MKLKSLILGSVAAAGLSTAGYAADLGVLTSLDVCDALGISGITISSETNCVQISGKVSYEFVWGDFAGATPLAVTPFGTRNLDTPDSNPAFAGTPGVFIPAGGGAATGFGPGTAIPVAPAGATVVVAPVAAVAAGIRNQDWDSKVEALLKVVGTASSDFGKASVTLNIRTREYTRSYNGGFGFAGSSNVNGDAHPIRFQDAYVSVGDTTILHAGRKGSIFNDGDDEPFNTLTGLFISDAVDKGVSKGPDQATVRTGGHVIQVESDFGGGFIGKLGLEALDRVDAEAGTLVGVLQYGGDGITAHISGAVDGLLDGVATASDSYAVHAGFTGSFDAFKLRAAGSFGGATSPALVAATGYESWWNVLVTGEATFDMFRIALAAEAADATFGAGAGSTGADYGFGGQIGAKVTEGVEINIGGRYFAEGAAGFGDAYQVAAQLVASLTETIKLTGEIGVYGRDASVAPAPVAAAFSDFYGKAELAWNPGGGFSSSVAAQAQQNGAYKVTFKAAKEFN